MCRKRLTVLCITLALGAADKARTKELRDLSPPVRVVAVVTEPVERTAVGVLSEAISKVKGATVEVVFEDKWSQQPPTGASIYLTSRKALPQASWTKPLRVLELRQDGFGIVNGATGARTVWVIADRSRGLLYGVYELLDRYGISYEPGQGTRTGPKLADHGEVSNPAFARRLVGTGYWEFLSEDSLRQWFRALSYQRVNGFVAFMSLNNYADLAPFKELWGAPLGHLIEYRDYPKLRWRERHGELIDAASRHLNRLIDIAEEYGVEVYLGTWEIGYPKQILEAYPELTEPTPMSVSNPATERYVRSRFRELANRFPRIKGVVYNGTESHSYVMKSETLPDGSIITRAERRKRFTRWAIEALRETIPDAVLVTVNGPAHEVREVYSTGTVFCAGIVETVYSSGPRPLPKVMDGLGLALSPVPQCVIVDETNEYRAQNAIPVADIYGWWARIAPTYKQGGFDEMLLCYTRSIPGLNPSGAYGLDVLNLHTFGSLAWNPLVNPDEVLHHWAQRFFPGAAEVMYRVASRSPEIFLAMWRKADNSAYVFRAPWFNYSGLTEKDAALREKALRMAQEDVAAVEAVQDRINPAAAEQVLGYLRARVRFAKYLLNVAYADRAVTTAMAERTPQTRQAVEAALAACRKAVDELDFPSSPWIDFRGHVSPNFARRMFDYFATQARWFADPQLEVIASSQPLCSDPPRNVMGIKATSASDPYFNSAMQLIDQVVAPTPEEQKVEPSAFSHPWKSGPGWPQGILLEFVRQQPLDSLTLHFTNVKTGAVCVRRGDAWQPVKAVVEVRDKATTFRFARQHVSAFALVIEAADAGGESPTATELTWTPTENGGLVGRAYSSCKYYHLRD